MKYFAVVAVTIDGKIARLDKGGSDWSSPEDKDFLRGKLNDSDVIIVGNTTYENYRKPLAKRKCVVFTRKVQTIKEENPNLVYLNPGNYDFEQYLKSKGYQNVCLLGGAHTYGFFLEKNLIDELFITIEPLVFGDGISLFDRAVPDKTFKLESMSRLNEKGAVLLHYVKM